MLDLYRWQREQALASERLERRNNHAYVMEKRVKTDAFSPRVWLAGALYHLSFHLAPNHEWNRHVAW